MSLRKKTYLLVGVIVVAATAAIAILSQLVFLPGFVSVETSGLQDQIKQVQGVVTRDLTELGTAVHSRAMSDETVAFIDGRDETWATANLSSLFFAQVKANVAIIAQDDGTMIWGKAFDLENTKASSSLPPGFDQYLTPESPLIRHSTVESKTSGILMLPDGPMLVDSRPIVSSDGEGPIHGAFIMGRWLDVTRLAGLFSVGHVSLTVVPLSAPSLPVPIREAIESATQPERPIVTAAGTSTVTGYGALDDIFGRPTLVLQVDEPRVVYARGLKSMTYFILGLIGVVVVFGLTANRLMERSLFRRLARLTAQVRGIRPSHGNVVSVAMQGRDELALLAQTINATFSQLDNAHEKQEKQDQSLAESLQELQRRHQDLERAHKHLQQLQEVSASLGGSLEISDALAQLEGVTLDLFDADEVWLLRLRSDGHQLEGLRAFCRRKPGSPQLPKMFGCEEPHLGLPKETNTLLKAVLDGSGSIFVRSIAQLSASEQSRLFGGSLQGTRGFEALSVVPLTAEDMPIGVVVAASVRPTEFMTDHRSTIALFADQMAQALRNASLYEEIKTLGEIDSLSGLCNRRRSLELLDHEVERARRYQSTFSLLIADIDNFKLFNDTYGHPVGDEIIKLVAGLLRERGRASDFVGRFGGDEFIVGLPQTYRAEAAVVADHIRLAMKSVPFIAPDGAAIPLRLSFGAASFPYDGENAAMLIAVADANLYESKRWGGDQVTVRRDATAAEVTSAGGFSTLEALVNAVDNKDHYTRRHSAQVAEHANVIAEVLGLSDAQKDALQVASLLHDVGKIAISDRILRKPGALTPEEVLQMNEHPRFGSMMVSQHLPEQTEVKEAVASHHERWDGSGYPAGLRGQAIPLLGRILAIADAYSAMITDRPYRAALKTEDTLVRLAKGSGTQFDPEIVRLFVTRPAPELAVVQRP